ncbi:arginine--tRNA ligase [Malassezia brasiliensis]|uniref:arginine--tRNA ligase n=1 Tax=Malassezia brasiliensis TaxID=1821822 RepID=A0AAF0DUM4_9BASI|nr:arginine--tRNA ligase [Malassezia brasiliensis]
MSHPPIPPQKPFEGVPLFHQLPKLPELEGTDPATSPQDAFRLAIADPLSKTLNVPLKDVFLAVAPGGRDSDFKVVLPRFRLPTKVDELQAQAIEAFTPNAYVERISKQGPALLYHVNMNTLTALTLATVQAMTYGEGAHIDADGQKRPSYGSNTSGRGKRIIVEFSSPNIAKPFHAGHLRSTIIGAFLANLYEANGWDVVRMNYLGDWGKQFGLLALGWRRFGSEEELKKDAVQHLYNVYVEINRLAEDGAEGEKIHEEARAFFKGMEDGKEENLVEWAKFRDLSIQQYEKTYDRLNVHFDEYSGESKVSKENLEKTMAVLRKSDITSREQNGALLVDLTPYKLEKAVLERKDGTPLYLTRDIVEAQQRWDKYHFDKMIYVVASQQDLHLAQFFKILELMGAPFAEKGNSRLLHINFGMVQGMSTRKGTAVFLDRILDETKEHMHEVMKKNEAKYAQLEDPEGTADIVGMTAVKIQDMSGKRINNYHFDWNRMFSFEGDTGPYLQYNHVRLCSMQRTNAQDGLVLPTEDLDVSTMRTERLTGKEAHEIVWLLATWPDVVRTVSRDHQASTIVTFCFKLTHAISSAWEKLIVKGQDRDDALVRLWLYRCAKDVLGSALRLLTITPLERM